MLTLITNRGLLKHERGVPSPVKLNVWVKFKSPKTLDLFLNPDKPWISLDAAREMVNDPKTKAWFAQVKNIKGFMVTSMDGKESTGTVRVDRPLKALVHMVDSPNGNTYMRVRLIAGKPEEWGNLPERFKVVPSKM